MQNNITISEFISIWLIFIYACVIILPILLICWCIIGIPYLIYNHGYKPNHAKFEGF